MTSRKTHIVFDLEATCWRERGDPERMEIIEIGATRLDPATFDVTEVFSIFVRPLREPQLSDFCKELTSIKQSDVDSARLFPEAMTSFMEWIGPGEVVLCSWGAYDLKQMRTDHSRHGMPEPDILNDHINLKQLHADLFKRKRCGMKKALEQLGIPLEGTHHRGVDDARNIAKIAKVILPMHYRQNSDR